MANLLGAGDYSAHVYLLRRARRESDGPKVRVTGNKGQRQPSEKDLAGARYQGQRVAEIAAKLSA